MRNKTSSFAARFVATALLSTLGHLAFAGDPPQPAVAAAASEGAPPTAAAESKAVTNNARVSPGTSQASAPGATQEDLGYDSFDGKTNKIASVYKENPVSVGVIYEARSGSRMIPRQDLNPQLAARFPYDGQAAEAFLKKQAAEKARDAALGAELAARQQAAVRSVLQDNLKKREQQIQAEISATQTKNLELHKEIARWRSLPRGNGRHALAKQLEQQVQSNNDHLVELNRQLDEVRTRRDKMS